MAEDLGYKYLKAHELPQGSQVSVCIIIPLCCSRIFYSFHTKSKDYMFNKRVRKDILIAIYGKCYYEAKINCIHLRNQVIQI